MGRDGNPVRNKIVLLKSYPHDTPRYERKEVPGKFIDNIPARMNSIAPTLERKTILGEFDESFLVVLFCLR